MGDGGLRRHRSLAKVRRSKISLIRTENCWVFERLPRVNAHREEMRDRHTLEKASTSKV